MDFLLRESPPQICAARNMQMIEINSDVENHVVAKILATFYGDKAFKETLLGMDSLAAKGTNDYTWLPSGKPHGDGHFSCWTKGKDFRSCVE